MLELKVIKKDYPAGTGKVESLLLEGPTEVVRVCEL